MLNRFFTTPLQLGLAQALAAATVAYVVVLLARRRNIHMEGEAAIAMVRGLVQIIAVGSVLVIMLRAPRWTAAFLLAAMIVAAGATPLLSAPRVFEDRSRYLPIRSRAGPDLSSQSWPGWESLIRRSLR